MSAPNKLSISLGKPKPTGPPVKNAFAIPVKPSSATKGKTAATNPLGSNPFGGEDDDDETPSSKATPSSAKVGTSTIKPAKGTIKQNASMSRAQRKLQEEALKLDQTVFEYDEVWDGMQNAREKVKEAKESEAGKRDVSAVEINGISAGIDHPVGHLQPKYIGAFLKSAETRRLDRLRAEEKMLQHERDKEGEEFADKEKFMTTAYKKQLEEVRQAEAEEKKREGESLISEDLM